MNTSESQLPSAKEAKKKTAQPFQDLQQDCTGTLKTQLLLKAQKNKNSINSEQLEIRYKTLVKGFLKDRNVPIAE